jgi:RNA polymerase sigma-70 factor (ECF subfamily)
LHEDRVLELVTQVAAAEPAAIGSLYDLLGAQAYGLALRVTRDPQIAEEAVQEAFLALWREAARFDRARSSPTAWIMLLVHRRAVDAVRREQCRRGDRGPLAEDTRADPCDVHHDAWLGVQAAAVRDAVAALSTVQRHVLELLYFSGLSQSEVARQLGEPLGTVKSRTSSALTRLRETLAPLDPTADRGAALSSA